MGLTVTSCDPSAEAPGSGDKSEITYLPKITLEGDSNITLDCDATSFTDPGAIAEAGGVEISLETKITGSYFGSTSIDGADLYTIAYSAFNEDGIPAAEFRYVEWPECNGDLVTSIAGTYTSTVVRNGSTGAQYQNMGPITVKDLGNGVYQLSDAIGGYYDYGRGYGYTYAATGMTITANDIASNDFTYNNTVGVGAFGGTLTMTAFTVDAANNTISFTTDWTSGYVFEVTLTQAN